MERLARELGAITVNNHILTLELETAQEEAEALAEKVDLKNKADAGHIDALTARVREQDQTVTELRALIDARKTLRTKEEAKEIALAASSTKKGGKHSKVVSLKNSPDKAETTEIEGL